MMYAVTFGLVPFLIMMTYQSEGVNITVKDYYQVNFSYHKVNGFYIWLCLSYLAYAVFASTYNMAGSKAYKGLLSYKKYAESKRSVQSVAIILLIIGATCMYLWSLAFDGIFNLILVGSLVRSSVSGVTNSLAFFKHPVGVLYVSTYLFFVLWKVGYNRIGNSILFLISLFFTVCYLLADDSRMAFAVFLFIMMLLSFDAFELGRFTLKKAAKIGILLIAMIFFLQVLDSVTSYIKYGVFEQEDEVSGILGFIGREFSYIYSSGQHAVNKTITEGSPMLFFEDIRMGLYAWLPSSMKPDDLISVWKYNTDQFSPDPLRRGTTPTDFVTTMIYDLGLIGPLIMPIFWGWVVKKFDNWHMRKSGYYYNVIFAVGCLLLLRLVNYNLLMDIVLGSFYMIIAMVIWKIYRMLRGTGTQIKITNK